MPVRTTLTPETHRILATLPERRKTALAALKQFADIDVNDTQAVLALQEQVKELLPSLTLAA